MATLEAQTLLNEGPFLSEGGLQTTLIYKHNHPLRGYATYEMLHNPEHRKLLASIHRGFADVAVKYELPLMLDMDTWRASANWYDELNTPESERQSTHKLALETLKEIQTYVKEKSNGKVKTIIHGVIGPRKDAYVTDATLSLKQARDYHRAQVQELKQLGLGVIAAYTLTTSTEALGIALEAKEIGIPCIISFTLDTDGRLPSGESLRESLERVDRETGNYPLFYMVNCVHPRYVRKAIDGDRWIERVRGVRGNASLKSHAELEISTELDEGVPPEFAKEATQLKDVLPNLSIVGGCCGTGSSHCAEIAKLLKN